MNSAIQSALETAITQLKTDGTLPADWEDKSSLSRTKDRNHGDFASNIAMLAAKAAGDIVNI